MNENRLQAAPVSADVPLISNQDVNLNIALIKSYHENLPRQAAHDLTLKYLERLGLGHIAAKRNPALSPEERFCVMLLRAAMVKDAFILIDRPFKMIPYLQDFNLIKNILRKIDDLYLMCHIYDYSWMAEKYGDL